MSLRTEDFEDEADKKLVELVNLLTEQLKDEEKFYGEPDYDYIQKVLTILD